MRDALELVVDVGDPLDLLVGLCGPRGVFLPCIDAPPPDARVGLLVRFPDREAPVRVSCVVVERVLDEGAGIYARFPNANAHALSLLRAFAPVLAQRTPPVEAKARAHLHAGDADDVRALARLAAGRSAVLATNVAVRAGDRVAIAVDDAWARGVLLIHGLSLEPGGRLALLDDASRHALCRFLERVARAGIAPRRAKAAVV